MVIETVRITRAPFVTDVFSFGIHFRGAPRILIISVSTCIVLCAAVYEWKFAFIARNSSAFEVWNKGDMQFAFVSKYNTHTGTSKYRLI